MRIETERLVLRGPEAEDVERLREIMNQEFVLRYNAFEPPEDAEQLKSKLASRGEKGDMLVLELDGLAIGAVGIEPDRLRYGVEAAALDYYIDEKFARRGYMSEALNGVLAYLFSEAGKELVSARVFRENAPSLALLEKLGFTREGVLRRAVKGYGGVVHDDVLLSILKEEFLRG